MLRRVLFSAALSALMLAPATAANAPTDEDSCAQLLEETESNAADRDLSDEDRAKVDELLNKLEQQCSASEYKEAAQTVAAINKLMPQ